MGLGEARFAIAERLRLRRRRMGLSWNSGLNRRSQDAMVRQVVL